MKICVTMEVHEFWLPRNDWGMELRLPCLVIWDWKWQSMECNWDVGNWDVGWFCMSQLQDPMFDISGRLHHLSTCRNNSFDPQMDWRVLVLNLLNHKCWSIEFWPIIMNGPLVGKMENVEVICTDFILLDHQPVQMPSHRVCVFLLPYTLWIPLVLVCSYGKPASRAG